MDRRRFILENTALAPVALCPELRLYVAAEATPLWEATEAVLARTGLPPPYWAFGWPGGQALARYLLDHPELVGGRRFLDFGAGSGVVAVAAARAGAAEVVAADIDAFACEAVRLNAEANGVAVEATDRDVLDGDETWDVIAAGDVCYEKPMAERVIGWLQSQVARGAFVLIGDPGRAYLPRSGLEPLARYVVPTSLDLEDRTERETVIYRLRPS